VTAPPILILLADLPNTMQEALERLVATQPDMRLVGVVQNSVEILLAADRTAPDVVILGMGDDRLPGVASHLLSQRPTVKVLGLTADGRNGLLYELRSRLTPIHDVSPAQLLGLIRTVVSSEVA
jgi:DNA-binding NarL/FixJ family response regulator